MHTFEQNPPSVNTAISNAIASTQAFALAILVLVIISCGGG